MSGDLGAFEEDVPFDWEGADRLAVAFDDLANRIEGQIATRDGYVADGLTDAAGPWAQVLVERVGVGVFDAAELVMALRDGAEDVRAMRRAADEEQARRVAAREWKRAYDENEASESNVDKVGDFFFGEDFEPPPMPDPPKPEPNLEPASPPAAVRD
jgi:hypothetical protein